MKSMTGDPSARTKILGVFAAVVLGLCLVPAVAWGALPDDDSLEGQNAEAISLDEVFPLASDGVVNGGSLVQAPQFSLSLFDIETGEDILLVEGVDYRVAGYTNHYDPEDPSAIYTAELPLTPDSYAVRFEGMGDYFGNAYAFFTIYEESDINRAYADVQNGAVIGSETLHAASIGLTIDDGESYLEEGIDYEIVGYAPSSDYNWFTGESASGWTPGLPSAIGDYVVKIQGVGSFEGNLFVPIQVVDLADIENADSWGSVGGTVSAEGEIIEEPRFNLSFSEFEVELEQGRDFEVAGWVTEEHFCSEEVSGDIDEADWQTGLPTCEGSYVALVRGAGDYTGRVAIGFRMDLPGSGEDEDPDSDEPEPLVPGSDDASDEAAPQTGDGAVIAIAVLVACLAAAGALIARRRLN